MDFDESLNELAGKRHGSLTEVQVGSIVFVMMFNGTVERAILETLAYSDVFDYPLRLAEIQRYLSVSVTEAQVLQALRSMTDWVGVRDDFYFLMGRENIVGIRQQREAHSQRLLKQALRFPTCLSCDCRVLPAS